ncbi:hypothetical protein P872_14775 [Rhodonellum psychrophilum GCM71 = DSM 17998]|uniref:Uncharacterized protein n=1 Tax=Rhodonellum psychrophilum GCM71 = DSM 17998 TaxID=1123057 RepID=U5C7X9_9BACT|nr:hypothetical protein P872_14775 [Rhodonellum psychrophilum GCM71 = DSM 17998]
MRAEKIDIVLTSPPFQPILISPWEPEQAFSKPLGAEFQSIPIGF